MQARLPPSRPGRNASSMAWPSRGLPADLRGLLVSGFIRGPLAVVVSRPGTGQPLCSEIGMTTACCCADNRQMKVAHWPLYGLRLRTPGLELRLPRLAELDALAQLSAEGVHDPAWMPFGVPWTDLPPAERARSVMQYHWRMLASWTSQDWNLQLAVFRDGAVAGTQSVGARDFPVVREVHTGSWLGQRYQGQGIGTEMRAAVLHLAFAGLNAQSAVSEAMTDNPASAAVSRKLGYQPNGLGRTQVRDTLRYSQRFTLDREHWQQHRALPVEMDGLQPCLPQFGLPEA